MKRTRINAMGILREPKRPNGMETYRSTKDVMKGEPLTTALSSNLGSANLQLFEPASRDFVDFRTSRFGENIG